MKNAEIEQSAIDRFGSPRKLEDIPEEELRQAIAECKTFAGVRLRLGVGSSGCSNKDVKEACASYMIDCSNLTSWAASKWEAYSDQEIAEIVSKCKKHGGNIHCLGL